MGTLGNYDAHYQYVDFLLGLNVKIVDCKHVNYASRKPVGFKSWLQHGLDHIAIYLLKFENAACKNSGGLDK